MNPEQAKALRAPFPPEAIGYLPKAGIKLAYVGHAAVTDRLLEVDPEWTWEPAATDENGLPILLRHGESVGLWIKMTIGGVTRYGFGDGPDVKQCISDAIRNAAMRYGVALDLWSKEDLQSTREEVIERLEPDQPAAQGSGDPHDNPAVPLAGSDGIAKASPAQKARITALRAELKRLKPDHPMIARKVVTLDEAGTLIEDLGFAINNEKRSHPELPVTA
jgi:hypothetical protein